MSLDPQTLLSAAVLAPVWPAAAALVVGGLGLRSRRPSEHAIVYIAQAALWLSFLSVLAGGLGLLLSHGRPADLRVGTFYQAGDYGFELRFLIDKLAVAVATLAGLLLLATSRFSAHYLHREPGFLRFFVLMLIFGSGMQLLLLGGSYDLMFAGWELVGLTSVLLVGFFHERPGPVRASLRLLVTYRLCDIGLLLAPVWLHLSIHSSAFGDVRAALLSPLGGHGDALPTTTVALLLIVAAMGKSAQVPVGGWLPRAMEGPTASSAVFYGGLSVHAGVYLLLRSAPLLDHSPTARVALVVIGGVTAVMAALSGQVSADAKAGLAYATISQVGLMFVECGLGLYKLATAHLIAHALLRYYQFLRTPSALQDALARRAAIGTHRRDETLPGRLHLTADLRRFLYRLAIERFEVEVALDRWLARPILAAARHLGALETRLVERLAGVRSPRGNGHPGSSPGASRDAGGGAP
ncbi:MAG: proton-conducting transporter membrane subunit [Polyangia bacterium]